MFYTNSKHENDLQQDKTKDIIRICDENYKRGKKQLNDDYKKLFKSIDAKIKENEIKFETVDNKSEILNEILTLNKEKCELEKELISALEQIEEIHRKEISKYYNTK